jgi:uncharacterized membrane protein
LRNRLELSLISRLNEKAVRLAEPSALMTQVARIKESDEPMKALLANLRNLAISGFFFLLPIVVIFVIIAKAWNAMTSIGTRMAAIFGVSSIAGFKGSHIFAGLLLLTISVVCGLLVRVSFVAGFHDAVEKWMSKYIPGYDAYKAIAEEKLQNKTRILPYASALVRQQECWLPAYVIEQDADGNYVLFVPDVPETSKGHVLLAKKGDVRLIASLTANQLDTSLKSMGKGLLADSGLAKEALPLHERQDS